MSKLQTGDDLMDEFMKKQETEPLDSDQLNFAVSMCLVKTTADIAYQLERIADSIAYFETRERCKGKS